MSKDTERYLKAKFEHEKLEEIIANNPIINEWRMAYVEKVVPPTEEEVCEALSEYYGFEVVYKGLNFITKIEHDYYYEVVSIADNCIVFTAPFPPHLVTLIGRFYEGLRDE